MQLHCHCAAHALESPPNCSLLCQISRNIAASCRALPSQSLPSFLKLRPRHSFVWLSGALSLERLVKSKLLPLILASVTDILLKSLVSCILSYIVSGSFFRGSHGSALERNNSTTITTWSQPAPPAFFLCACKHAHVHTARKQPWLWFLGLCPPWFLTQGLLVAWTLPRGLGWLAEEHQGPSCLHLDSTHLLYMDSGIRLRSLNFEIPSP